MEIKDRITIRLNEEEKAQLRELGKYINESDLSKIIKSGFKLGIFYLKYVSETVTPSDYDIVFIQKRKTNPLNRKLY